MTEPRYYTIKDIAERLRVSERHVRRLIERGDLVATRFGGSVRVSETDLQTYERVCRAPVRPAKADR